MFHYGRTKGAGKHNCKAIQYPHRASVLCAETPEGGRNGGVYRNLNSGMGAVASQDCIPHQSEWTQWTVHWVYGLSLITYLRLIWVPHQNALAQNILSARLGTPIDLLAGACVVCDVVCMSRDVFPIQIRVTVFFMTRLCRNGSLGVSERSAGRSKTCSDFI